MKPIIVIHSYHHNNTRKVAEVIGDIIISEVMSVYEIEKEDLVDKNLIGFGSGIDSGKHYTELLEFASELPPVKDKKCFIFSTSAMQGNAKVEKDHKMLKAILLAKGYKIIGEFSCKGFNTNSFLKYIGGINRNRPNEEDISHAKKFALYIKQECSLIL
ncbi:MAG: flavodoxin [Candidatus Izimaplasma bacterium HR2]|nr:MAG: flavodoxin [Candidatus Izimaplasma bacterium HR2]